VREPEFSAWHQNRARSLRVLAQRLRNLTGIEEQRGRKAVAALLAALFLSSAAQAQEQPRICGSYKTVAGVLQSERFAEKPIQRRSRDGRTWEFWASLEGRTWTILELLPNRACLVQSGENAPLRLGEEVP
jgi:hypothetical protein